MSVVPPHKGAHLYRRFKQGNGSFIWRCMLNGCPHFLRKDMILGRVSVCPRCREDFVMGQHEISLAKPHCKDCTRSPKSKEKALEPLPEESPL